MYKAFGHTIAITVFPPQKKHNLGLYTLYSIPISPSSSEEIYFNNF